MPYPKVVPLSPTDAMFGLATHKVLVDWNVLAALGAGANLTLQLLPGQTPTQKAAVTAPTGTVPIGTQVRFAGMHLVTAFDFSDASINSLLIEVGDGGDTDRFLTSTEIAIDGTEITDKVMGAVSQPYAYLAADGIDILFTAAGGASPTVQEATSGDLEIFLWMGQPQTHAR